ncbi:MAG: hypothetical protein ACKVTZ_15850 [Bacteroidia bacterium]
MKTQLSEEKIAQSFAQYEGVLTSKQLTELGMSKSQLKQLIAEEKIDVLKRGWYQWEHYFPASDYHLLQRLIPDGVVCFYSACDYYELTNYTPNKLHVAVLSNKKVTLPKYPPIQVHYWQGKNAEVGLTEVEIEGKKVRIYDLERCVCDIIRMRHKTDIEELYHVIQSYVKRKDRNLHNLGTYAKIFHIDKIVDIYIGILLYSS